MRDGAVAELLDTIDEQSEIIMRQADRINRLSALLLQKYEVEKAEVDSITERTQHEHNMDKSILEGNGSSHD